MCPLNDIPLIDASEMLARFVVKPDHVRKDGSIRHGLFFPYKHTELSVTRLRELELDELWRFGSDVAQVYKKPLLGRSDLRTDHCHQQGLAVAIDPLDGSAASDGLFNPHHANIIGYPPARQEQIAIAQELVKHATSLIGPEG